MKVLHICTSGPYTDGFTYQDNLITEYMVKGGHKVFIIATPLVYNENGQECNVETPREYINDVGVKVIRLPFGKPVRLCKKLRRLSGFEETLQRIHPDIIFFHNPQSVDAKVVSRYLKKHDNVRLFVDSHADFSNSARNWISREILHKIFWRHYAQILNQSADRFYGVLPARVDFLTDIYGIPKNKVELLVMGGDDELAQYASAPAVREAVRMKYGIDNHDFLIVTGGKIDSSKAQTLLLMKAVHELQKYHVKLIVFGSVSPQIMVQAEEYIDNKCVFYAGWADTRSTYEYFASADLVVFPGRHSVYWEQVVSQGKPMICKYWEGTTHVDIGGNVIFLKEDSSDLIRETIEELMKDPSKYSEMVKTAGSEKRKTFLYSNIANRSISGGK